MAVLSESHEVDCYGRERVARQGVTRSAPAPPPPAPGFRRIYQAREEVGGVCFWQTIDEDTNGSSCRDTLLKSMSKVG